jgi:hypothetical protein
MPDEENPFIVVEDRSAHPKCHATTPAGEAEKQA